MRTILILAMFAASLADAAVGAYEEVRQLTLDTGGINTLKIKAGAGYLDIVGVPGSGAVNVTATIHVPGGDSDETRAKVDKDGTGSISVTTVGGDISVRDGTGGIKISDVAGSVTVKDGTGDIDIDDVEKDLIIVNEGTGGVRYSNIRGSIEKGP